MLQDDNVGKGKRVTVVTRAQHLKHVATGNDVTTACKEALRDSLESHRIWPIQVYGYDVQPGRSWTFSTPAPRKSRLYPLSPRNPTTAHGLADLDDFEPSYDIDQTPPGMPKQSVDEQGLPKAQQSQSIAYIQALLLRYPSSISACRGKWTIRVEQVDADRMAHLWGGMERWCQEVEIPCIHAISEASQIHVFCAYLDKDRTREALQTFLVGMGCGEAVKSMVWS
ncbi:hypothetical protein BZG36_00700 [Bifiguratus adelaidae]|uniref:Uncharacterized protein n=1 Tax=Bifiguratus adelaidae TaxID=1938954 RepID=A0A261Y6V9_9FUNG|nr:hypothetical protein BZG36_00700 [Bifiguratus adelaidae]